MEMGVSYWWKKVTVMFQDPGVSQTYPERSLDLMESDDISEKSYTTDSIHFPASSYSSYFSSIDNEFDWSGGNRSTTGMISGGNISAVGQVKDTFNYSLTSSHFEEEDNVSNYNGELSSRSPLPVFGIAGGSDGGTNGGGSGGDSGGDDDTFSSLPADFTRISELNKDCIIVYAILFLLAAVGNLLVLSSVSRHDRLGKSRTPLLIMNLCIADLIVTFFHMPTEIVWRLTIAWKGGDALCKLSQFIRAFGLYLSSNVVICISIDRYFAIVYPLKLAGAVKRVKWMLVGAWIVSAVFAGPQVFVYHVASHPEYPEFRQCITKAFLKTGPYNDLIYNVSSVSALYFIPLLVIIYTYSKILWKIHQKSREHQVANSQQETVGVDNSNSSTQLNAHQSDVQAFHRAGSRKLNRGASKRTRLMLRSSANQTATLTRARSRTLRLTLLILLTFIFCWTPYVVMTLWYMVDRGGASQVDARLQEALFIMAVTNSVINPLIYGTVGRRQICEKRLTVLFRSSSWTRRLLKVCCCCCLCPVCCCGNNDSTGGPSTVIMMNRIDGRSKLGANGKSHMSRDLSPRSQVVTLRTMRRDSGIVSRFVRSFGVTTHHGRNTGSPREKDDCIECGITSHFIVPEGGSSSSRKMSATQV